MNSDFRALIIRAALNTHLMLEYTLADEQREKVIDLMTNPQHMSRDQAGWAEEKVKDARPENKSELALACILAIVCTPESLPDDVMVWIVNIEAK
jgi:hypothetical protein